MSGSWRLKAACRDAPDKDIFHPIGVNATRENCADALSWCARCQVTAECLDLAMSLYYPGSKAWGIFGNTTDMEREAMLARRRQKAGVA